MTIKTRPPILCTNCLGAGYVIIAVLCLATFDAAALGQNADEPSGPYCGIYSLYAASRMVGSKVPFDAFCQSRYVSDSSGSTLDDLARAAKDNGLCVAAASGLSTSSLHAFPVPAILHVKDSIFSERYDHWVLFAGMNASGDAIILDSPSPVAVKPLVQLSSRWDGNALFLSNRPLDLAPVISSQRTRIAYIGCGLIGFIVVVHLILRWLPSSKFKVLSSSAFQLAAIVLLATTFTLTGHHIGLACALTDHDMVMAIQYRHFDTFPSVTASDVEMAQANRSAVIVDARFSPDYASGHLDGAVNVPVANGVGTVSDFVATHEKATKIIIYCQSESCPFSRELGNRLAVSGFSNIAIFRGGWMEWKAFQSSKEMRGPSNEPK